MKKPYKRILSLLLCLLMCMAILPIGTFAADADNQVPVSNATTKYRALLIGEYRFPTWLEDDGQADRMKGDITQMKYLLSHARGGKGGKYSVTYKYNRTNKQIKSLISSTFRGAKSSDVSLFFITTHGVVGCSKTDPYAGALITTNSTGSKTDYLLLSDLAAWLKKIPGKVIVVISSCSSGSAIYKNGGFESIKANAAAFDSSVIRAFADADENVNDGTASNAGVFRKNKFYVLTASKHNEESWGWEWSDNGSYNFMPYFMRVGATGKKPADTNGDKKITLHELYAYTYKKCIEECKFGIRHEYGIESIQHVQVYPTKSSFIIFR